jgi:hypothetical protein
MYLTLKNRDEKTVLMKAKAKVLFEKKMTTISDGKTIMYVLKKYIGDKT